MTSNTSGSKTESNSDKLALMSKSTAPSRPKSVRSSRKHVSPPPQTELTSGFYRAFEERYRGPRDLIKHRLSVYLPFVEPLRQIYPRCTAIDLGCGRGEWLELLQKNGFEAQGVDLDDGMLAACTEFGLTVTRQEAIGHLKSLDDNSQCIVSGFHFVEHIPFADLRVLVAEALRVLKSGGLLIFETPNPENVVVGTTDFYLDPTHQRPIPPLLLSFLPEYQGFKRVKILRLQESPDLASRERIVLKDVFFGASPDYAIVAQKDAAPEILLRFSAAFDKHYGIGLDDLTDHYDAIIAGRFAALDQRVGNAESAAGGMVEALSRISALQDRLIEATTQFERSQSHATQLAEKLYLSEQLTRKQEQRAEAAEGRAAEQERRAEAAEGRAAEQERRAEAAEGRAAEQQKSIDELGGSGHRWWLQACALETERNALRQSLSWKITAPLRLGLDAVYVLAGRKNLPIFPLISLHQLVVTALGKPRLVAGVHRALRPFPRLYAYVTKKVANIAQTPSQHFLSSATPQGSVSSIDDGAIDLPWLTPSARRIYAELKAAVQKNREAENAHRN